MPRKGRKRLTVDIPENIHFELKEIAKKRNVTITKLILEIIGQRIVWEKQYE